MPIKTYVLYHANCWDGFCAAWIARGALRSDTEFIPVQYGQEPPKIEPRSELYIVDFSYPREQLFYWWAPGTDHMVQKLVVLDHHKTAKEALAGFDDECMANGFDAPEIVFDMEKSGGRLTWEHFHPGQRSPWLVDYTEDRDLWRWKLESSKEINAFIRSWPLDFDRWNLMDGVAVGSETWLRWIEAGEAILRREQQIIDDHLKHAREIEMDGHKILVVNATVLFSDIAGELAKDRPFGACYFDRADGKRQWSLRSRNGGVDVSAIAKSHGGGGHFGAAGFEEGIA